MSLVQLALVTLAILTLKQIGEQKPTFNDLKKPLIYSLALTAGLALTFALRPTLFLNFKSSNDASLQITGDKSVDSQILRGIVSDRESLMRSDAFRSLVLILLAAGLMWAWISNKIKDFVFYPILILLVIFDMFGVAH